MEYEYENAIALTRMAATVADIAGFEAPAQSEASVGWFSDILKGMLGGKADRVFMFSADAVPLWLIRQNTEMFARVYKNAPISLFVRSVMPTVTPVNYAAFFSGALPEKNGIDRVVQPILSPECTQPLLQSDSLIAAAVRAGLRTAVITCANGCIASMLSRSGADFYIIDGDDDEAMYVQAKAVVESDTYDFVFLYQLGFDYAMHASGPESDSAVENLKTIIGRFDLLCESVRRTWKQNTLIIFNSDHGCHLVDGKGYHGDDTSTDTDIVHFFGVIPNGQ